MDDLRIKAMDYALAARANAEQDVVELAERIHDFLAPRNEIPESAKAILGGASPPPIPDLVQKVRHDADLSQADQTPCWPSKHDSGCNVFKSLIAHCDCQLSDFVDDEPRVMLDVSHLPCGDPIDAFPDDDTKTRIISRAHHDQFSEAG